MSLAKERRARPWNPDRPFRPAALPFFYGWAILAASSLGILASIPGQTMGVSVFSDHLITATGLSRVQLSNAYLFGTLTSGCLLPFGGRLLDRHGERKTAVGACLLLALALVWLALVPTAVATSTPIDAEASRPLAAQSLIFAVLVLGFAALRFGGQGMLTLASRNMVPKWFERRRGLASGLLGVFVTLGFSYAPLVLAAWIDAAGDWRAAWLQIALVIGVGVALFAWACFRDDPEQCGLEMDGRASSSRGGDGLPLRRALELRHALQSGAYWAVTIGLALQSALVTGMTFHIVDLGAEAGLTRDESVALFPPIAVIGIAAGLLAGAAVDRVRLRWVLGVYLLGLSLGYGALAGLEDPALRRAALAGLGVAGGCFSTLTTVAAAKLFGRTHLGAISSAQMSALVLASAVGPSLFAWSRAATGSYATALLGGACLPLFVLVTALLSRDPGRERRVW